MGENCNGRRIQYCYDVNRAISKYRNSAISNRPQCEDLGNNYRVCGVRSLEPRAEANPP